MFRSLWITGNGQIISDKSFCYMLTKTEKTNQLSVFQQQWLRQEFSKAQVRQNKSIHLAHSYVWIPFLGKINMFSDIKGKPDTLSIRRLTLAVISSLRLCEDFFVSQCQEGQSSMTWHRYLHVYLMQSYMIRKPTSPKWPFTLQPGVARLNMIRVTRTKLHDHASRKRRCNRKSK